MMPSFRPSFRVLLLTLCVLVLTAGSVVQAASLPDSIADRHLQAEIRLRQSLAFRSDPAYIRAVHAAPDAVVVAPLGASFTPVEAQEVQVRLDLERDGAIVQDFFVAHPHLQAAFGGVFIDHGAGGNLVVQLVRDHPAIGEILSQLPPLRHRDRLRIQDVTWSKTHLMQQEAAITQGVSAAHQPAVQAIALDLPRNRVVVTIDPASIDPRPSGAVPKHALPGYLAAVVADPAVTMLAGTVRGATTAILAAYGWNTTGGSNTVPSALR